MEMMTDWQKGKKWWSTRDSMNGWKDWESETFRPIIVEEASQKYRKKPSEINNENIRIADVSCIRQ